MIPNSRMGSVIGKGGSKIKEIQDASGARLNASEGMLPGSTEVFSFPFQVFLCSFLGLAAGPQRLWSRRCYPHCDVLHWEYPHRSERTNTFAHAFELSAVQLYTPTRLDAFLICSRLF